MRLSKYLTWFLCFSALIILQGCPDPDEPPVPEPKNMTAKISGEYEMTYEAPGAVNIMLFNNFKEYVCSSSKKYNDTKYSLGVYIFFPDFEIKPGTFNVKKQPDASSPEDCAVASFEIGDGPNRKVFMSDSGKVVISELHGGTAIGTFYFYATEKNEGTMVTVDSGVINFKY